MECQNFQNERGLQAILTSNLVSKNQMNRFKMKRRSTYSFFFYPFFLKFRGFLPAVIGSQVVLQGEEYLLKNNNNFISDLINIPLDRPK